MGQPAEARYADSYDQKISDNGGHSMIYQINDKVPNIAVDVFVAPNATIIGDVTLEAGASIWFGAVLRGDIGKIRIGTNTNVQDNCVIHVNAGFDTLLDANVTVGHGAILEGCHIQPNCLIGMNATVLSGAVIGSGSLVAAGAVVPENKQFPGDVLIAGIPARVVRPLTPNLKNRLATAFQNYKKYGQNYQHHLKVIE